MKAISTIHGRLLTMSRQDSMLKAVQVSTISHKCLSSRLINFLILLAVFVGFALLDIIEAKKKQIEDDADLRNTFTPEKLYELAKEHEQEANMEKIMRYAYYYMEYALKLLR